MFVINKVNHVRRVMAETQGINTYDEDNVIRQFQSFEYDYNLSHTSNGVQMSLSVGNQISRQMNKPNYQNR